MKVRLFLVFLGGLFLATQVHAHGTHATFISPDKGELVSDSMKVHIKKVPPSFPYVRITVRKSATENEQWTGLVPLSDAGYVQTIEVKGWEAGSYVIEAQFLGDLVEQVQQRSIVVGTQTKDTPQAGAAITGPDAEAPAYDWREDGVRI